MSSRLDALDREGANFVKGSIRKIVPNDRHFASRATKVKLADPICGPKVFDSRRTVIRDVPVGDKHLDAEPGPASTWDEDPLRRQSDAATLHSVDPNPATGVGGQD